MRALLAMLVAGFVLAVAGMALVLGISAYYAWSPAPMPQHIADGCALTFIYALLLGFASAFGIQWGVRQK